MQTNTSSEIGNGDSVGCWTSDRNMELLPLSERSEHNSSSSPVTAVNEPLLQVHSTSSRIGNRSSQSRQSGLRLVKQNGHTNVLPSSIEGRLKWYISDFMTSIVELPFYYHMAAFFVTLFVSWTVFGLLWWLVAAVNGDLLSDDELHLLDAWVVLPLKKQVTWHILSKWQVRVMTRQPCTYVHQHRMHSMAADST